MSRPHICWRCLRSRSKRIAVTASSRYHAAQPPSVPASRLHQRELCSTALWQQDAPSTLSAKQQELANYFTRPPRERRQSHLERQSLTDSNDLSSRGEQDGQLRRTRQPTTRWPAGTRQSGEKPIPASTRPWRMPVIDNELKDLLTEGRTPLEIWHRLMATNAFQGQSLPEPLEISFRRSPELKRAFHLFIQQSLSGSSPSFPSLEKVLTTFLSRGLFRHQMLAYVLRIARPELAIAVFGEQKVNPQVHSNERAVVTLMAIMDSWRLALEPISHQPSIPQSDRSRKWTGLPSEEEIQLALKSSPHYFERFNRLFAGRVDAQLEQAVAADAAWTYLCFRALCDRGAISDALTPEWSPWTELMRQLLTSPLCSEVGYIHKILVKASRDVPENLAKSAAQLLNASSDPPEIQSQAADPEPSPLKSARNDDPSLPGASVYHARLLNAEKQGDDRRVTSMFYDFINTVTPQTPKEYISDVLAEFSWHFARVRKMDGAIMVWQHLRKSGISPAAAHWTAMVEVAKRIGSVASVRSIWLLMLEGSYEPPNQAWTAYITALLKVRDEEGALRAVAALDAQWRRLRSHGAVPDHLKPSMIPINAAISGFLAIDCFEPIDTLLRLASRHGLRPGTDTFNILLKRAIDQQDSAEMLNIFKKMKAARCEPDHITFSLVIDGLLRQPNSPLQGSNQKEQEAAITQLFTDLAAAGMEPSAHTYSTLLNTLLGSRPPHVAAVQAILQRMDQQGIRDKSVAYTMLITHFFSRDPPDIESVEKLRQRIADEKLMLDSEFYNRLAYFLGEAGEYDHALSVLRHLNNVGGLSLRTANAVLAMLVQKGDFENAKLLVAKVQRELVDRYGDRKGHMAKENRLQMPRWLELIAQLRASGQVIQETTPFSLTRKIMYEGPKRVNNR